MRLDHRTGPGADGAAAVTYDPAVVPVGATATLTGGPGGDGVEVRLAVAGLVPPASTLTQP